MIDKLSNFFKEFFTKQNQKLFVRTMIVSLVLFIILSVCFFFSLMEIPLGFLLGVVASFGGYLLRYIYKKNDQDNSKGIVFGATMSFLLSILIIVYYLFFILLALFLYHSGIAAFNYVTVLIGLAMIDIVYYLIKYFFQNEGGKA